MLQALSSHTHEQTVQRSCSAVVSADTPLAQAVGGALPLVLYKPAAAARLNAESEDESETPSPQVPNLRPRQSLTSSEQDELMQACYHDQHQLMQQKESLVSKPMWPIVAAEDAGVVPSFTAPPAAPRRSLSLSAIVVDSDSSAHRRPAAPSPLSAQPPLLFRGLSASDFSLLDIDASGNVTRVPAHAATDTEPLMQRLQQHQPNAMDTALRALWEDCDARGLFRYNVSTCSTRVLEHSRWRWVAQLNEGRATKKRATELKLDAVLQPFDASRFHFGKAAVREALLQFEPLPAHAPPNLYVPGGQQQETGAWLVESSAMPTNPTLVLINVSPIEHGHVLLVPRVLSQLPQRLGDANILAEALAFVREVGSPAFRLGYNALGAYASINHLHLQGYYLHEPFPCELAQVVPLSQRERAALAGDAAGTEQQLTEGLARFECVFPSVEVGVLADYPVRGWVVQQRREAGSGEGLGAEHEMAQVLARLTAGLEAQDQPYNVLVVDCGRRAYVWPQCFGERLAAGQVPVDVMDTGVNPAAFEIAGHLLLKRPEDYAAVTDEWAARLLSAASLSAERFERLTRLCVLDLMDE